MNQNDVASDGLVIEWLAAIEARESTRTTYTSAMHEYCVFVSSTPEDILTGAEREITDGVLMRNRSIKKHLLGYREMLKKRELAPNTIRNRVTAIRSFYRSNEIDLPQMNGRRQFSPKPLKENDLRLEKDDIRDMLKHSGLRDRAIILVMTSSGLAQADILELRVKDFKNGYDEAAGRVAILNIRRIKTDYDFTTFLTPEASQAVLDWIDLRNQQEKTRIRSDNNYLFTRKDVPDEYLKKYSEKLRRIDPQGFMAIFRRLARKTGKETEKGTWGLIRSHNLRKFFNSTLLNGGADIFFTDFLMGHKIDTVHQAYFRADPVKLREKYMKYIPFLSIEDTEVKTIESMEYHELKQNYTTMCKRVEELESRESEKDTEMLEMLELALKKPEIVDLIKKIQLNDGSDDHTD